MREPPSDICDDEVLTVVQRNWLAEAGHVEYLPIGFGAHHWVASVDTVPQLFVTLDSLGNRHTAASLAAAYRGAATLAKRGLEFVLAPLPPTTVPVRDWIVSVTPWHEGVTLDEIDPVRTARMLQRLHGEAPPAGIPKWQAVVPDNLAEMLRARLATQWNTGPFGARVRSLLTAEIDRVARWAARYHELVDSARSVPWVVTHGEPHQRNQLVTADGVFLIDWESLKLAPAERDLRTLVDAGRPDLADPRWPMVEMFDLEWRLDEISQYATWFSAQHEGTASDQVAFNGLLHEIRRPEWLQP